MDRRRFMRLAGAAGGLATTALAGCSSSIPGTSTESGSVTEGEQASYAEWLGEDTTQSNGLMNVSSLGGSALVDSEDENAEENDRIRSDALATVLVEWGVQVGFVMAEPEMMGVPDPGAEESETDRFHWINGTRVLEGNYDPARIGSANEDVQRIEDDGDYTLYIDDGSTLAVSEDAVLWARDLSNLISDPTARVQAHIDATASEDTRYASEHDAFADLQDALPNRGYSGVVFDPDGGVLEGESNSDYTQIEDTELESDVLGYTGSSTVDGDNLTASVAVRYADAEDVDDRETIESALGAEADERTIEIDGPMVIVEGEYTDL